jgi:hypothetical protein
MDIDNGQESAVPRAWEIKLNDHFKLLRSPPQNQKELGSAEAAIQAKCQRPQPTKPRPRHCRKT